MSGLLKINITEPEEVLKKLLLDQKTAKHRERVEILYLLVTNQAETVGHLAALTGRHRVTISRWLSQYRQGGLEKLLTIDTSPGRQSLIPETVKDKLKGELEDPEGFNSYTEIQKWLLSVYDIQASYGTIYKIARYQLKAKLKVPRPVNIKQEKDAVNNFKKKLPELIQFLLDKNQEMLKDDTKIRYWCQDESRFGMKTVSRRKVTIKGVKPIGIAQWQFLYRWLYGLVEPLTGNSFFLEFTHLNSICFEKFLELFAEEFKDEIHIIQLDNGGFHKALNLNIPENIILLFQPPYTPQVNPIERLWEYVKEDFKWINFDSIEELQNYLTKSLNKLTQEVISRITGWEFIINALSMANI